MAFLVDGNEAALDLAVSLTASGTVRDVRRATGPAHGAHLVAATAARLMANLISVERASLALGTAQVLDDVSLGVDGGDRIGVVGRNGGGKSTLLRVLAGVAARSTRGASRARATPTLGMLAQGDDLDPRRHRPRGGPRRPAPSTSGPATPASATCSRPARRHRTRRPSAASTRSSARSPAASGAGSRWPRLLVANPDLLLLDEPTNHLDVEGVAWLAEHLVRHRASPDNALVAITHDRWFLDAVATMTWEVARTARCTTTRAATRHTCWPRPSASAMAAVTAERRENLLRKELAWLRRGPPARTSKPKFRIEAANALIADEPPPRDDVELLRFATTRLGKDVIDLVDATVELGGRPLLDHVTWRLAPGERVGIVGVNGAGKTTLLRAIAGEVPLAGGKRKAGPPSQLAYLTQEVRELERYAEWRVIEAVEDVRKVIRLGRKEISASQLAERLGFTGGRQQTRVGDLSGGERRRLQLIRLLMAEPNVLLLDEPTNDLDIETLTSLEDLLDGWAGHPARGLPRPVPAGARLRPPGGAAGRRAAA